MCPALIEAMPTQFIELSPELAEEKGIKKGDKVRVFNNRGSVVVGLGVMAGLAAGYKRDKMTYNPATTDTISVDAGDVLKRGDGQDTELVQSSPGRLHQ